MAIARPAYMTSYWVDTKICPILIYDRLTHDNELLALIKSQQHKTT